LQRALHPLAQCPIAAYFLAVHTLLGYANEAGTLVDPKGACTAL